MSITFLIFLLLISPNALPAIGRPHCSLDPIASEVRNTTNSLKTYIIYVQPNHATAQSDDPQELERWYRSFLPSGVVNSGEPRLVYSYSRFIMGFAARLTDEELADVKKKDGFLHAHPDRLVPLQTTYTPEFLGLHRDQGFWKDSNFGKGVIIGVLDSGILPTHPSFDDHNMPPPPAKWKGSCEFDVSLCNNKLIGARTFTQGMNAMRTSQGAVQLQAPYDYTGHGTHVAGTAAGMFVDNANVVGQFTGTAAGIAPYAHLAIYKVCGRGGCPSSDILAGLDSAIADEVDIVSLSLGGPSVPFYLDATAIGTFRAMEKGIFVSCAAGNSGPSDSTLSNEAPWMLTVGASTVDRSIRSTVELGSGVKLDGEAVYLPMSGEFIQKIYQPSDSTFLRLPGESSTLEPRALQSDMLPLVYPGSVGGPRAAFCLDGSLAGIDVKGKIVVCDILIKNISTVDQGVNVKGAGGAAIIIANGKEEGHTITIGVHVLPASHVSYDDGLKIKSYIQSVLYPRASITLVGTLFGISPAPAVASFSSRGPNRADLTILKPDIIGPGVNILAASPFPVGPSGATTMFNIMSGTSMATPHLSGVAALLKNRHPDWSPAAIKSAIMTTATLTANDGRRIPDQNLNTADFFALGSGHVNPTRADNPGLVYDISSSYYIAYLCGLKYTDQQVSAIAGHFVSCSSVQSISGTELNLPSFMVPLNSTNHYKLDVFRMVTNVGAPNSIYEAQVMAPQGVSVVVNPQRLTFSQVNEKATFKVTFSREGSGHGIYRPGSLKWVSSDGNTIVNSPIMVQIV
ncbi:subtilisin-like protease 4 [Elaeis guineensis]|uniref:Subtilisin-like protease SBT1.2 n=1 Tax=Elaeis guineensis var. tenera TaxID=51953 RepID=A0A6I9SGZ9_ELAGV|nr:subtilisin-like protease SBT1.2 [Elaeis guineensis]